jgi:hypothetical protein
MQLVEQHIIRNTDARFRAIDRAAFASKNLYNAANYLVRQTYIQPRRLPQVGHGLPADQEPRGIYWPAAQGQQ